MPSPIPPSSGPNWPGGYGVSGSERVDAPKEMPGNPQNPANSTFDFLEDLYLYYQNVKPDPEMAEKIRDLRNEAGRVYFDFQNGKITSETANDRINSLKARFGFPNMDDEKNISMRIAGSYYNFSTGSAEQRDVAPEVKQIMDDLASELAKEKDPAKRNKLAIDANARLQAVIDKFRP